MSEPYNAFKDGVAACLIVLFILLALAYYVNYNQAQSINDLQRRVAELEQKK